MGVATTLQVFDQQAYDTRVHPALVQAVHGRVWNLALKLLRETVAELHARHEPPPPARDDSRDDELEAALEILEGSTDHDDLLLLEHRGRAIPRAEAIRTFVEGDVRRLLIDRLCNVRVGGVPQRLNLWDSGLSGYLYERSRWMKNAFDGMQPPFDVHFQFSRCQATSAIPPWFVHLFLAELRRVPRPPSDRALQREYDLLLGMLERATGHPALRLVVEVS